jgi:hypothetical protein
VHLAQEAAGLARVLFGNESGFTENPALTQAWAPKGEPHAHEMKTGTPDAMASVAVTSI